MQLDGVENPPFLETLEHDLNFPDLVIVKCGVDVLIGYVLKWVDNYVHGNTCLDPHVYLENPLVCIQDHVNVALFFKFIEVFDRSFDILAFESILIHVLQEGKEVILVDH